MACIGRLVAPYMHLLGILELGKLRGHVFRYIDEDRSRPAGPGNIEGLFNDARHIGHVSYEVVVLRARPRNADNIRLLEGVIADERRIHLTGEYHDGHRIHIGGCNAGHRICGPRAGGHKGCADPRGGARVAVCRVHGRLLVSHEDLFYVRVIEGIGDIEHGPPGVAKKRVYPFHL